MYLFQWHKQPASISYKYVILGWVSK